MVALLHDRVPGYMRLVGGDERRMFQRKQDHRVVEGRRTDHSVDARRNPDVRLMLRDISVGGVGAIVDRPLAAGERVFLHFPMEKGAPPWSAQGRVVRCEPAGIGYRIGVAFDALPKAA